MESCCATNKIVDCGLPWSFDTPTATDICSGTSVRLTVFSTVTNGVCPQVITRTWQAIDECGHSAECCQSVTVVDTTPPVLAGCQNVSTNSLIGTNGNFVSYPLPGAMDNCAGPLTVSCDHLSGSFFPVGQTVVSCLAVDQCGNTGTCSFTVTVVPNCLQIANEVVRCASNAPGGFTYNFDLQNHTADTARYVVLPSDLCLEIDRDVITLEPALGPGQTRRLTMTLTLQPGCTNTVCFPVSIHTSNFVQCCAVERCLVLDATPPTLAGCQDITVEAESGLPNTVVNYTVTTTDDSLGSPTLVCLPPTGSRFSCGATTVRCVATDACGNTNTCSFIVTVSCGKGDLMIEDTPVGYAGLPDMGDEPDVNMTGQPMWVSRGIWVHRDCLPPDGTYLSHQNPYFGQQNCVFAEIKNRGSAPVAGTTVELWYANASLGLVWSGRIAGP